MSSEIPRVYLLEDDPNWTDIILTELLRHFAEMGKKVDVLHYNTWKKLYTALKTEGTKPNRWVILKRQFPLSEFDPPADNLRDALHGLRTTFSFQVEQILVLTANSLRLGDVQSQWITVVSRVDDEYLWKLASWADKLTGKE